MRILGIQGVLLSPVLVILFDKTISGWNKVTVPGNSSLPNLRRRTNVSSNMILIKSSLCLRPMVIISHVRLNLKKGELVDWQGMVNWLGNPGDVRKTNCLSYQDR